MKKFMLAICIFLTAVLVFACAQKEQTDQSFCMNTVFSQTLYGADDTVLSENNAIWQQIEKEMSRTIKTSDVSMLNSAGGSDVQVSAETAFVLTYAKAAAQATDGAFNPTLGALTSEWGFGTQRAAVPSAERIAALMASTDYNEITLSGTTANIGNAKLDLGGVVKGYALDRAAANMKGRASGALIYAGGSVYAQGKKPDGKPFVIGIRDPFGNADEIIGTLTLENMFVSTSGVYERGFEQDGVWYHHILSPKTGRPVDNSLVSVSVISAAGIDSDVYSTALFVKGLEEGLRQANAAGMDAVFITADRQVYTTDGFAQKFNFKITNEAYQ